MSERELLQVLGGKGKRVDWSDSSLVFGMLLNLDLGSLMLGVGIKAQPAKISLCLSTLIFND